MSIGRDYVASINTATWATPTWATLGSVKEPSPTLSKTMATNTDRGKSWEQNTPGVKSISTELTTSDRNATDSNWQLIRDSYLNDALVDIVLTDLAVDASNSQGPRAEYYVSELQRSEPEDGQPVYTFSLVNGDGSNDPEWFEVA